MLESSLLRDIENSFESYQRLITFYEESKNKSKINLVLESWFAANMAAALGAVLDIFLNELKDISFKFDQSNADIEAVLRKNDFLTYFGYERRKDSNNTTIPYQKLAPSETRAFHEYLVNKFVKRSELPEMSEVLTREVTKSIYEIFVNAQMHSETRFIYSCGQYFPKKNDLEFTIVDTGKGFKKNINERFNRELSGAQAIAWAVQDTHTTKRHVTGGLGLALLKEFIFHNGGRLQIISDDGFYQYDKNGDDSRNFAGAFPGTIVNLKFKTNDKSSYYCENAELDLDDIF